MSWWLTWAGWTEGLSDTYPLMASLGMLLLLVLAAHFAAVQSPRWRWFGQTVLWCLLFALLLRLGRYATLHVQLPWWVWMAAVVLLPLSFKDHRLRRVVMLAWLFSLFAGLATVLQRWGAGPAVNDTLVALALAGWAVCAVLHWVWPRHREPKPLETPDETVQPSVGVPDRPVLDEAALLARLDSRDAQEGADKYTRE